MSTPLRPSEETTGNQQLSSAENSSVQTINDIMSEVINQLDKEPISSSSRVIRTSPSVSASPDFLSRVPQSQSSPIQQYEVAPLLESGLAFGDRNRAASAPPVASSRRSSMISIENLKLWSKKVIPRWRLTSEVETTSNKIEYSVFRPPVSFVPVDPITFEATTSKEDFESAVNDVVQAIEHGIKPTRISQGSSGSYFLYGTDGVIVGVFKPKDEEPYGPLSPKWTKWLHRTFFPCFFGRSCLIPNLGYICESAASTLDRQLKSYIVPYTDTIFLSSDSFYYSYWDWFNQRNTPLPKKVGSLQLFLHGYQGADLFLSKNPLPSYIEEFEEDQESFEKHIFRWTHETIQDFREELEKLVILDYIMRNTDRGLDNWMIKVDWISVPDEVSMSPFSSHDSNKTPRFVQKPKIRIGAIDSGLAFPWKHPDEWRSFPFGWLFLPLSLIGQPFSEKTRSHYLSLLTSTGWWENTSFALKEMFSRDSDFKERMWLKQLAVIKGQAFNVVETLKDPNHGPLELTRRTRMLVWDDVMEVPVSVRSASVINAISTEIEPIQTRFQKPIFKISHLKDPHSKYSPEIRTIQENQEQIPAVSSFGNPFLDIPPISVKQDASSKKQIRYEEVSESTPLKSSPNAYNSRFSISPDTPIGFDRQAMEASKKVIIERLLKAENKPPVFTWC